MLHKILSIVMVLGFSIATLAAELPDNKITVQEKQIGLRDALTRMLQASNYRYKISNNVTNDKKVTLEVHDAKWSEVFKFLIAEGELNYRVTSRKMILVSP
jgi:hypothetical protein